MKSCLFKPIYMCEHTLSSMKGAEPQKGRQGGPGIWCQLCFTWKSKYWHFFSFFSSFVFCWAWNWLVTIASIKWKRKTQRNSIRQFRYFSICIQEANMKRWQNGTYHPIEENKKKKSWHQHSWSENLWIHCIHWRQLSEVSIRWRAARDQ